MLSLIGPDMPLTLRSFADIVGEQTAAADVAFAASENSLPALNAPGAQASSGLPTGTRGWETIPSVIHNNATDSFRVEVNTNGPVQGVTIRSIDWGIVYPGSSALALRDDGLGLDRVAGDNIWTAGPFHWNTARPLADHYEHNPDSPAGIEAVSVGEVQITEADGTSGQFLIWPSVGVVRSDIPDITSTSLATNIAVSPHLINIQTSAHETQRALHASGGSIRNLTNAIYQVLPDAYDSFMFFSTDRVELAPWNSAANYNAGMHNTVQRNYTGTGDSVFDNSRLYGSQGRLLGWNLLDTFDRGIWGSSATHELVHQWAAYTGLGLSDGTGHYVGTSSAGSLVGGTQWIDNGDGTFTMNQGEGRNGAFHASPLDKYFMGLIGPDQLPTTYVFTGAKPLPQTGETIYPNDIAYSVTANQLISAYGSRTPSPATAQRHFNLAFVAESYDRMLTPTEMTFYEILAAHYTKVLPADQPDPYVGDGWQPITRFFGEGTTFSSEVQHGSLTLTLSAATLAENATAPLTATVWRPGGDVSAAMTVWLTSSDPSELAVPRSVVIPAGQTSATFTVQAVNDDLADGTQTATIKSLAYPLVATQANVEVTDDEPVPVRQLRGSLWSDLDQDGVRDVGEPALTGWTVYLDANENRLRDSGETATQTDTNGDYAFDNPPAGTVDVAQVLPAGWVQQSPLSPSATPAVTVSIHDEPRNGSGDALNSDPTIVQRSTTLEDRAIGEFDVRELAGRSVAKAMLEIRFEPDSSNTATRQVDLYTYSGNGVADLTDFSASAPYAGSVGLGGSPFTVNFDVVYRLQQILNSGGLFFGVRYAGATDNCPALRIAQQTLKVALSDGWPYTMVLGENEIRGDLDFGSRDVSPPTVLLTVPSTTNSATPVVSVMASDNAALPDGTLVAIDADFNRDGDFYDPGEVGCAYGLLIAGTATFPLNAALPEGTYNLRATLRDSSGNTASSTASAITVEAAPPRVLAIQRTSAVLTGTGTVDFSVTFSETVSGVGADDFVLRTTGTIGGAAVTLVSGSGRAYTVTVNTGSGSGTLRLDLTDNDSIVDGAAKSLGGPALGDGNYTLGQTYTIDKVAPVVSGITRLDSSPTAATSVRYQVTFSKPVSGVDAGDFSLVADGPAGAQISSVSGSGTSFTITVSTGTGDGTLRLDLADNDTILDAIGNRLGGNGAGNGNATGPIYTIERDVPVVVSITRRDFSPTSPGTVRFQVTFSEAVTGVNAGDFKLTNTGLKNPKIQSVSGSGKTYIVTVSTGTGGGTLRLDLIDDNSIKDLSGKTLGGAKRGDGTFTKGETYTIVK
ncbi:MAG: hypothetical protein NTY19_16805 [Planctomycetota bacterium]|nr:hypothetical protein [Planctomycetota bacterium]